MKDTHIRSIAKAISWRVVATVTTMVLVLLFTGNIALKASEGVAQLLTFKARKEFQKTLYGRLAAWVSLPVLNAIRRQLDPRRYNGASLLGLKGIVVKSHGSADELSFAHAIEEAIVELEKMVPERISSRLEEVLIGREFT